MAKGARTIENNAPSALGLANPAIGLPLPVSFFGGQNKPILGGG